MNVPAVRIDAVIGMLPAMKTPTVSRLHNLDYFSLETVVPKGQVNQLIPRLKAAGAEDILEIHIAKIVR
jgi:ATP phosphoribosyltransferase